MTSMDCFPCCGTHKKQDKKWLKKDDSDRIGQSPVGSAADIARLRSDNLKSRSFNSRKDSPLDGAMHIAAQTFTLRELAAVTKNFSPESLLGEGRFGCVYKGRLENTDQVVAVKQLGSNGLQGNQVFLVQVLMMSLLHHPNLVNLIGYCVDGDQRLLVYEFMPLGCLENHLHDLLPDKEALDWNTRMKIAAGTARGLEYLHDKANPPVIYQGFRSSNILLDEGFHPKLSDFGLVNLGSVGDKTHISTHVKGTYGYCAPEYATTGQLTSKSDVYSFGVVLLELITGRKAFDNTRAAGEHDLVPWARLLFKDRRKLPSMADPMLQGQFPMRGFYQAVAVAAMCLQEQAATRPLIGDIVTALSYLASQRYDPSVHPVGSSKLGPSTPSREKREKKVTAGSGHGASKEQAKECGSRGGSHSPAFHRLASTGVELKDDLPHFRTSNGGWHQDSGLARKQKSGECNRYEGPQHSCNNSEKALKEGPNQVTPVKEREQAVAEARVWGENWRERKRVTNQVMGDGYNAGFG